MQHSEQSVCQCGEIVGKGNRLHVAGQPVRHLNCQGWRDAELKRLRLLLLSLDDRVCDALQDVSISEAREDGHALGFASDGLRSIVSCLRESYTIEESMRWYRMYHKGGL